VLSAYRFAVDTHGHEDNQEGRVRVSDYELVVADLRYFDAELFVQLSPCRGRVGLAWLALPTGEFPQSTVSLVERSLAHEKLVSTGGDCGDDSDELIRHLSLPA